MSEALVKTEIDYSNREVIDTIKQTVAKGATDAQLAQFLQVCKATGLNPFLKEVWCIPQTNTIMTSRDGYLRIANDHPQFDGMETKVERNDKGTPIKATCSVWRKDRSHAITCEAYYDEYKKDSNVWKQYSSAMISKVAEVLALKRSFAINGVVTQEEIDVNPPLPPMPSERPVIVQEAVAGPAPIETVKDARDKSVQIFNDAETTKTLLKVALKKLASTNNMFTEVEHFRDLIEKDKAELRHIDEAKTDSQIRTLEKALDKAEIMLKDYEEGKKNAAR